MYERKDVQQYLATRVARPSSAGVIVENDAGEALVLKANYKRYWSFPGGWVEDTQTPPEAAARELEEEAGITVSQDTLEFAFVVNRKSSLMQTYQFLFRTSAVYDTTQDITLQASEIDSYEFISKAAVLADETKYGLAVVLWAQGDSRGYVEQQLDV